MKKRMPASILGALVLSAMLFGCHSSQTVPTASQLSSIYTKYARAAAQGDLSSWKKYASTFAIVELHGLALSKGQEFDDRYIKDIYGIIRPIPLDGLQTLAVHSKGDTAKLVLYGKPKNSRDSGNVRIVPAFHVVDFLRENGNWKVHHIGGHLPSQIPNAEVCIERGDFDSILTNEVLQASGVVPRLPDTVTDVELPGMIQVNTGGYVTEVWINGIYQCSRSKFVDNSGFRPIRGGLNSGTNSIKVVIARFSGESCYGDNPPDYLVGIGEGKDAGTCTPVFLYGPTNFPSSFETTFNIDRENF